MAGESDIEATARRLPGGSKAEVGRVMGMLAAHGAGHVAQIRETRRIHGL